MKIAFYAPMKAPDHPVPSGDRTIARNLMAALEYGGAHVTLASTFSCREGKGDAGAQAQLLERAAQEVQRVIEAGQRESWQAWVSYHNYYKAPDLLGPAVCDRLGIPYLQIESTRARKRLGGPWDLFAQQAEAAADRADLIFFFTQRDAEALRAYGPPGQLLHHLRPFLGRTDAQFRPVASDRMISVGMMRSRDKLPSYRLIAETLALLEGTHWSLVIVGDGPARAEVEALMAPFGSRVIFRGALDETALRLAYEEAGIFLWPGVNEAIGMTYLEAQAASLAIVAQDRPGLRDALPPGDFPPVAAGAAGLARDLTRLLSDRDHLEQARRSAFDHVARNGLLPRAAQTLAAGLAELGVTP